MKSEVVNRWIWWFDTLMKIYCSWNFVCVVSQMAAMLSVVFVLYLVALACAYNFTCSDQINSNVTFQPADDYGRYIAKICTRIPADATHWSVDLTYNNGVKTCNQTHHSRNPGKMHSQLTLNILDENIKRLNCTRTVSFIIFLYFDYNIQIY